MILLPSFIITGFDYMSLIVWVTFILCSLSKLEYIQEIIVSDTMVDKGALAPSSGGRGHREVKGQSKVCEDWYRV